MEKPSIRQRSLKDLAERVLLFKRTIKQWFYYAGLKYLKTHTLTDSQETFLEDITDYFVEQMDGISSDNEFFKKPSLPPIQIKKKIVK